MRQTVRSQTRRKWEGRRARVMRRIGSTDRVYLTIYRSAKHIYAQLVDPITGRTITSASTRSKDVAAGLEVTGNVEAARRVGRAVAEQARERNIDKVVFNRNGFLYHGRVKALAEAAREAGLRF